MLVRSAADPQRLGELQLDRQHVPGLEVPGANEPADLVGGLGDDAFPADLGWDVGLSDIRISGHGTPFCDSRGAMSRGPRTERTSYCSRSNKTLRRQVAQRPDSPRCLVWLTSKRARRRSLSGRR